MNNYNEAQTHRTSQLLTFAIAVYLMLWLAIVNGYPIFFDDTGEYLIDAFGMIQSPYRSIIYPVFIRLSSLQGSLWLVVIAQSAIAVYLLRCVFEYIVQKRLGPRADRTYFLALVAFLAFATSLPWYVGQLMPDVFSGLAFLAAFLLFYDPGLSLERMIALSLILALAVGCHLSNILGIGAVIVAVAVIRAFRGLRQFWPTRTIKGIVGFVLVPMALIVGTVCLSNYRSGFGFRLSAGSPVFMFNRLLESGLAEDYLESDCQVEQLTPCKYLHHLPKSDFFWGTHPLLKEMGGWLGARQEAGKIATGTIRKYPVRFAVECLKQTFRQFVIFKPDDENYPIRSGFAADAFNRLYPAAVPAFQLTKQWSGRLAWMAKKLYHLYKAVFWISLCLCLFVVIRGGSRFERPNNLVLLTLIYLVSNAFVTGSLSGAFNRYQSRVNWLMALCLAAYGLQFATGRWKLDPDRNPASGEVGQSAR